MTTVYCSGLMRAPKPSPGLGVARSLREAFPDLHLVGVANSARSTALHHAVFDEVWLERSRGRRSSEADAGAILERLDTGAWWIPGCEREARWLARTGGGHDGILGPASSALEPLDASPADLAARLGLLSPPALSTLEDDWLLNAFGREHGWRLRLTGPGHAASPIEGWRALERARARLGDRWWDAGLRLQAHIDGARESIAFAAYRGDVLGARHMRAAIATSDGTSWGGAITDLADAQPGLGEGLARELAAMAWTGGGEIEMIRSVDHALWLTKWRPRFAGWVHGCTLAGANLAAALFGAAAGRSPLSAEVRGQDFVRVVIEIPRRARLPLPEPAPASDRTVRAGAYLAGMPDPAQPRAGEHRTHRREAAVRPTSALRETVAGLARPASTPHVHRVDPAPRWSQIATAVRAAAGGCRVAVAYSIKTDPHVDLLGAARRHGMLAEAISAGEMRMAQAVGFADEEIILNGPAKRWPPSTVPMRALATFADSLEELTSLAELTRSVALATRYLGPRLRPPSVASRFGVQLADFSTFSRLVAALQGLPAEQAIGLHFHWASSDAGHATWFDTVDATLEWGRCLQDLTERPIHCLDLGGGWSPDDFDSVLLPRLPELVGRCVAQLDALELVVLEPGRALVQPLAVVETAVLEVRDHNDVREIVVDASLAELPRAGVYPHRILSRASEGWCHWGQGPDRVLGRLCMEDDVLRVGVAIPDAVGVGARLLLADAGAYDRSMAYGFGGGRA